MGFGLANGRLASGDACGCNDTDADGHVGVLCGGDDCEDGSAAAYPGATESCDGLDDDCDGELPSDEVDADGDGVLLCAGDCDDAQAQVAPGLPEVCGDGLDNDCAGGDEPCPASTGADEGTEGSGTGQGPAETGTGAIDPGEADGTGSDGGTDTAEAEGDGTEGGCACSAAPGGVPWSGMLVLLALLRRRRPAPIVPAAVAALSLVACGEPVSSDDEGQGTGTAETGAATTAAPMDGCELPVEIPQLDAPDDAFTGFVRCNDGSIHRTGPVECAQPVPTGIACNGAAGECDVDADCTGAPYGACLYTSGFFSGCTCVYGCVTDADCAEGQICACGGSAPGYPQSTQCISAACVDDGACQGSACGLGHEVHGCGERWITACRTPDDACLVRQDCAAEDDNCLPSDEGAWACASPSVC
jgi:uncharacterized protein (TIGR03382 family)